MIKKAAAISPVTCHCIQDVPSYKRLLKVILKFNRMANLKLARNICTMQKQ